MDSIEFWKMVVTGMNVAGAIRVLVNARSLQHNILLYGSDLIVWREKEKSRIRALQMDNLRGLLGNRRIDSVKYREKRYVK